MTFVETVPEQDASGAVAEIYESDREVWGRLPNFTQAFSQAPEVYKRWRLLNGAIKESMELRRYELATVAAARRLRSSYCTLAHGSVLMDRFFDAGEVQSIVSDFHAAGLSDEDVAVMELAEKVVDDATTVSEADFDRLRAHGLPDSEIVGVVLAAAARCFFSKTLDALGVRPDASYRALAPELLATLTVGRPVAES